jgi:plasmid stabilization system protein ParE
MRKVVWSTRARADFAASLAWLLARNPEAAAKLAEDVEQAVAFAARRPFASRAARASGPVGIRIKSMPKWRKIIIYAVETDGITILSIRDTRQETKET